MRNDELDESSSCSSFARININNKQEHKMYE